MYKLRWFFNDLITRIGILLKLWLHDKIAVLIFAVSGIVFLCLLQYLNLSAEQVSKLPVGIVNLDTQEDGSATSLSEELVDRISKVELLKVHTGTTEQMEKQFAEGKINCYFTIEDGYEKNVRKGRVKHLITVNTAKGDTLGLLLSDIMAGAMMEQICRYQAYVRYEAVEWPEDQKISESDYVALSIEELKDESLVYGFSVTSKESKQQTQDYERLEHSAFYRQMVAGIFAILISFVILFFYSYICLEQENNIQRRLSISGMNRAAVQLGTVTASILPSLMLCLIFAGGIAARFSSVQIGMQVFGISCCYTLVMAVILYLICVLTKGILTYQLMASVVTIIFGILGFISALDGLVLNNFLNVLKNLPNGWFITRFIDIIVQ